MFLLGRLCPSKIGITCSDKQCRIEKYSLNNARSILIDPTFDNYLSGSSNSNSKLEITCSDKQWRIQKTTTLSLLSPPPYNLTKAAKRGSRSLVVVRAVSVPESTDGGAEAKSESLVWALRFGGMFCLWYSLNIYFNIYNKQVLKVYPFPTTITAFQFGCGSVLVLLMWAFNLHPKPKITRSQFVRILPLAITHVMGNLLTNVSLGKVAVSFTHTIKAMEPFFTVLFSVIFLGEMPNMWVILSLLPIVGGVALASFTEASFNWLGFSTAMASNVTNQSRNVLSKKFMLKEEESLDNINLFSVITILCFLILMPTAIFIDGIKFSPSYFQFAESQGVNVRELCVRLLVSGLCFHTYQQVSYMILGMVSPVTHSVGNCLKRVVVIVSSVLFFQTPISPLNAVGTAIALSGVFLYTRAKRLKQQLKAS